MEYLREDYDQLHVCICFSLLQSTEAIDAMVDSLDMLGNSTHAQSVDLLFLKEVMKSRLMKNLIKVGTNDSVFHLCRKISYFSLFFFYM